MPATLHPPFEPSAAEAQAVDRLVAVDQLRLLFSKGYLTYPVSVLNASLYALLVSKDVPLANNLVWLLLVIVAASGRLLLRQAFWRARPGPDQTRRREHWSMLGAAVNGLTWGSAALFAYPQASQT